jgi:hypothetical protein
MLGRGEGSLRCVYFTYLLFVNGVVCLIWYPVGWAGIDAGRGV